LDRHPIYGSRMNDIVETERIGHVVGIAFNRL
jgi:hypothetical protein